MDQLILPNRETYVSGYLAPVAKKYCDLKSVNELRIPKEKLDAHNFALAQTYREFIISTASLLREGGGKDYWYEIQKVISNNGGHFINFTTNNQWPKFVQEVACELAKPQENEEQNHDSVIDTQEIQSSIETVLQS